MDTPATAVVTRPADANEDPYVWQPPGAFGPQAVTTQNSAPQPEPDKSPLAAGETALSPAWRWRDFLVGLTFGAITVAALSLVFNFDRR